MKKTGNKKIIVNKAVHKTSQFFASALLVASLLTLPVEAAGPVYTVNFKDADIQEVVKYVADTTGKTFIVDPAVKGRIKVISSKQMDAEELYNLFLAVLDVHGFAAIESGNVTRIVSSKEARSLPLEVKDSAKRGNDGMITQVIQLKNVAASKALPVLRPMVPQHAHMAAYDPSNAIIITDTEANIARLQDVIDRIDRAAVFTTELVHLKHAGAEDLVRILTQLQRQEAGKAGNDNAPMFVADKRSNGILISGDDLSRTKMKQLIARLDMPQQQSGNVQVIYLEYAEAKQVATVLTNVVKNMSKLDKTEGATNTETSVEADEDTNSLLITADPATLESLKAVIARLDIRRAQVLVEAIIVEMLDDNSKELGIQWLFGNNNGAFSTSSLRNGSLAGAGELDPGKENEAGIIGTLAGLANAVEGQTLGQLSTGGNNDFLVLINALQKQTDANILSTPSLLTSDNHTATINVGQNVPFVTGSFSNPGTGGGSGGANPFQTIQRENVGIMLEVTPHINEGNSVVMEIKQEVSSIAGNTSVSASDLITNKRTIETRILAADGEVVVLGGLMKDDLQTGEQKVPIMGDIPLLGRLFRSNSTKVVKSNLMVFIRATIIRDDDSLRGATAEKYKYIYDLQQKSASDSELFFRAPKQTKMQTWDDRDQSLFIMPGADKQEVEQGQ
ncbi:type II secretion system secretin GspD [Simiduia aestuariiviva]|uniref:General secretion pathway protein D n=1 Tax=Simiduia aestuariiviva TaxID=1510459 RepID=A0A839UST5_9GAMM|nr:type II secretion system secretin GspD [Simiduia aestuariiviva]MBB3169771.1 general secretion pathway protein D [Simiduia aestuariiviva]